MFTTSKLEKLLNRSLKDFDTCKAATLKLNQMVRLVRQDYSVIWKAYETTAGSWLNRTDEHVCPICQLPSKVTQHCSLIESKRLVLKLIESSTKLRAKRTATRFERVVKKLNAVERLDTAHIALPGIFLFESDKQTAIQTQKFVPTNFDRVIEHSSQYNWHLVTLTAHKDARVVRTKRAMMPTKVDILKTETLIESVNLVPTIDHANSVGIKRGTALAISNEAVTNVSIKRREQTAKRRKVDQRAASQPAAYCVTKGVEF